MKYLRYLWYICKHKWFVFIEACLLGIPGRGLTHDLSKFLPDEFFPYTEYFYGGHERGKIPQEVQEAFDRAWLKHQHRNPHHWQYWLLRMDVPQKEYHQEMYDTVVGDVFICEKGSRHVAVIPFDRKKDLMDAMNVRDDDSFLVEKALNALPKILPMQETYAREMLADWKGAGRAIMGKKSDTEAWYLKNRKNMLLAEGTRHWIEDNLLIEKEACSSTSLLSNNPVVQ